MIVLVVVTEKRNTVVIPYNSFQVKEKKIVVLFVFFSKQLQSNPFTSVTGQTTFKKRHASRSSICCNHWILVFDWQFFPYLELARGQKFFCSSRRSRIVRGTVRLFTVVYRCYSQKSRRIDHTFTLILTSIQRPPLYNGNLSEIFGG